MVSIFRAFVLALAGLAFAAFGLVHAFGSYPGPDVFARLPEALPTLRAVLSFAFGVITTLIGAVLLAPPLYRLRRRRLPAPPQRPGGSTAAAPATRPQANPFADHQAAPPRMMPPRRDERYDGDDEPDEEEGGGEAYDEGGGYPFRYDPRNDGRYPRGGGYDGPRRWAGSHRG
jgi:hypothetical protein